MTLLLDKDIRTREVLDWKGLHLLHFRGSSCSQKIRIFLNLKEVDWISHSVNLASERNHTPWFLGINPRGLVPVLVHNGKVHIESNDILQYLEKLFPKPKLIPEEFKKIAPQLFKEEDDLHLDLRSLSARYCFGKLAKKKSSSLTFFESDQGTIEGKPDIHKEIEVRFYKDLEREGITNKKVHESANNFKKYFEEFEIRLGKEKYLLGNDISLIDIAWFIYTHRLSVAGYPFNELHPNVFNWYKDLYKKEEFFNEIHTPLTVKLISKSIRLVDLLKGEGLRKILLSS